MPSIKLETSAALTKLQEQTLALEITEIASAMLNKPVEVIQVRVAGNLTLTFGGAPADDSAFLEIALIGNIRDEVKAELPKTFAELFKKYGIDPKKLFLHYTETTPSAWGWL